jgi:hypothetical protein
MFSFLRSNKSEAPLPEPGAPIIAFLMVAQPDFPAAEAVERLRALPFVGDMSATSQGDDGIVAFYIGDETVGVGTMPAPYPDNLDAVYAGSWMFPDAAARMGNHAAHVIVSLTGGAGEPVQRLSLLTRIVNALTREAGVLGIYWPDAGIVHRPDIFSEMTEQILERGTLPLYLWVNLGVWRNEDNSHSLATTGLNRFGRYEVEVLNVQVQAQGLREYIYGVAHMIIKENPPVKDGMEVGRFGSKVLRASLKPSILEGRGTVIRMNT